MISAYCWPQSAHQRESITLYCHTNAATYQYEVIRQGAVDEPVLRRSGVRGQSQLMSQNLAATGCHWQPSLNIAIDPNSLKPKSSCNSLRLIKTLGQFETIVLNSTFEYGKRMFNILFLYFSIN